MAYIINRYNGTVLTTVEDGTVNTTTELKLIGKNFAGYGEAQNENYLFLLESFSNTSAPTRPLSGMLWYDSGNAKLRFYNGNAWKTTGGAETSTSPPSTGVEGDFWWDTTSNQLKAKNANGDWVLIGPQRAGTGITQMTSIVLTDTLGGTQSVISATVNDIVIYIISANEFTIAAVDAIPGFDTIKPGLTLVNTTSSTNGITTGDFYYWGTASNSLKLNGIDASVYDIDNNFANRLTPVLFNDYGYTVGNDVDFTVKIDSDTETPMIKLHRNLLRIKNSTDIVIATVENTGIHPGASNAFDLGTPSKVWATIYANSFNGTVTKANQLRLGGSGTTYVSSATSALPDTIAARDSVGNLTAVLFQGTATKARYADLAEKYTTSNELPPGTAVSVCTCNTHEVEPSSATQLCIGVVSTNPAVMMNSDADGQYIGLKGRLPVRVKGAVRKGQAVYAIAGGVSTIVATSALVGIALETNLSPDEKLVECVLKV